MKQIIWTSEEYFNEEAREEYQKGQRTQTGNKDYDVSDEEWAGEVNRWLDDERSNLDKEVDGVIVAFADLGLWHGHVQGYKIIGSNVADILRSGYDAEWYGDTYNIRGVELHHDGTNRILYRIAKDRNAAGIIADKIYNGEMNETQFRRLTRSLYPYVARIYGWKIRNHRTKKM